MCKLFDPLVKLAGLGANVHIVADASGQKKIRLALGVIAGLRMPKKCKASLQGLSA